MTAKYMFRFFFEYGGGCLWGSDPATKAEFGYLASPEELPLSKETLARIELLELQFETSLNWDYPMDPCPWRQPECDDVP
jgi:hypothetical protein